MQIVNGNTHNCVTCDHYVGDREPYCFTNVKYESPLERGKCYETFATGMPVYLTNCCPRWRKWGAVK